MPLILPKDRNYGTESNSFIAVASIASNYWSDKTASWSGSANTKGSWNEVIASTPFDVHSMHLAPHDDGVAELTLQGILYDIGVGASTAEQVLLSNLPAQSTTLGALDYQPGLQIPIFVPKGTRLSFRFQSELTGVTLRMGMQLYGGSSNKQTFRCCDTYGANTSNSFLTDITSSASAGTETAWTNIGSTTTRDYWAIMPVIGHGASSASFSISQYHLEVGYSSTSLGEYKFNTTDDEYIGQLVPDMPIYTKIPSGTQLQARIESGTAAAEIHGFAFLCFY